MNVHLAELARLKKVATVFGTSGGASFLLTQGEGQREVAPDLKDQGLSFPLLEFLCSQEIFA